MAPRLTNSGLYSTSLLCVRSIGLAARKALKQPDLLWARDRNYATCKHICTAQADLMLRALSAALPLSDAAIHRLTQVEQRLNVAFASPVILTPGWGLLPAAASGRKTSEVLQ